MPAYRYSLPYWCICIFPMLFAITANTQVKLPYDSLLAAALDGRADAVLSCLEHADTSGYTAKDREFRNQYSARFGFEEDRSSYLSEHASSIDSLLRIYRDYWRASLLHPTLQSDSAFTRQVFALVAPGHAFREKQLDHYLKKYIRSRGYETTGFGRTGKLLDLLVWRSSTDTVYTFRLQHEQIRCRVVMMDRFITLGWEEYATLGMAYPGGWATKKSLYCVRQSYDLQSENFRISYLCHEGRHFSDYRLFPHLQSADLEYRAKLTELCLLETTLFDMLERFIHSGDAKGNTPHALANYYVIRDLSLTLFGKETETDLEQWKRMGADRIHAAACKLLQENTLFLKKQEGKKIHYIP